eukprot:c18391_g1_i1 orf=622-870(+)
MCHVSTAETRAEMNNVRLQDKAKENKTDFHSRRWRQSQQKLKNNVVESVERGYGTLVAQKCKNTERGERSITKERRKGDPKP